ncbi:probable RNA-binding protein 19 isoform X2 [Latimeria chalumnae]|uniref:probable RNA-binding protein 19 isoform X2 n=1 Tax=Latimeria chalumnae TaxID=7897 RepID=UPI00313E51C8
MSRLIVKNLPNGMKEDRFRKLFSAFGTLTDCSLKFTKDGKFRKFGFVGFKSEQEAETALKHFNKSFIDTARVTVEFCKSFGDPTKPRAWSKHSQRSQTEEKQLKNLEGSKSSSFSKKDTKKKDVLGIMEELKEDKNFEEFLAVHQNRNQVPTWSNDTAMAEQKKKKSDDYLNFDDSEESEGSCEEEEEDDAEEKEKRESKTTEKKSSQEKLASQQELSDMEYLKAKVVKEAEEDDESSSEEDADRDGSDEREKKVGKWAASKSLDRGSEHGGAEPEGKGKSTVQKEKKSAEGNQKEAETEFTVKLRGAPFNVKEQQIREFFVPLKPAAIRIVKSAHGNTTGYVFVDFKSEDDLQKALKRNKDYIGGRYIEVFRDAGVQRSRKQQVEEEERAWLKREKKEDEEEEDISESGRLFVRNLPYTCMEEDLEKMFSEYGPLSEVLFPIDSLTKKPKGFAFVTYMMPEHAVKAYAALDGGVLQGRMIHILPSTIKKEKPEENTTPGSSSYKKQKESKEKANSSSSHNWNTLFMGTNAIADAIAQKYNTTKSQVLDHEGKGSVAVRVALGEIQLVQETRRFLIDNGVSLDSFSQAAGERSKTVILVKNLPAGTHAEELEKLFSKYGDLGRVVLPPAGITAIMEFLEPTEAKRAFTKLAYSKFQHVPLYLEWAPVGVFSSPPPRKEEQKEQPEEESDVKKHEEMTAAPEKRAETEEEEEDEDDDEETLPGCTLFIKNLDFSTTEETLKEAFSKAGTVKSCTISKKKDKTGVLLSMGYGFLEYKKAEEAQKALRQLQHCMMDGHQLELKISERATKPAVTSTKKKQTPKKQKSSKILVRNIPFQATVREVRELFSTFGELKTVRLPKKMSGTGSHRGFGFVDFITKHDAKKAFKALCHSTHLYGRRLVLEWADSEETVEALRRKTAEHFHDAPKKKRSEVMEEIMEQLEGEEEEE